MTMTIKGDGTVTGLVAGGLPDSTIQPSDLSTGNPSWDTSGNFKYNSGYGSVATAYGCRAWVNFNGTGTVAIRASGNVSSITDNGVGDYTVNFTTAMPDTNYSVSIGISTNAGSSGFANYNSTSAGAEIAPSTNTIRFYAAVRATGAQYDPTYCYASILR